MPDALFINSVVRSIQTGSLYALIAIGLTLTMAVIRLPNFAHAEYVTIGAYVALFVSAGLAANLPVMLIVAFLSVGLVALVSHVVVFRPLERRGSSIYNLLLASFALGFVLRYGIFLLVDYFNLFDKRIQVPLEVWVRSNSVLLTNIFFWAVPTSLILVVLLNVLLKVTPLGREMRALADNYELARILGIRVERVKCITWFLVGGLTGVGGAFWGIYTSVHPMMGWSVILSVFAVVFLGGLTSFFGTIASAYIVSFSENTIMQFLNFFVGLDFSFKPAIPFIIIVAVLLLRPQGFASFFSPQSSNNRSSE